MKKRGQFVFVLGPHRSGSSLVAAALHSLGANLGNRYIQPNDDNPKGFFEDEEIVKLNDRLLRSLNLAWDSFGFVWEQDFSAARLKPYHDVAVSMVLERFSAISLAALKDPRFCIVLPFWKQVISEALDVQVSYVLSIREPGQCVRSQKTRHLKDSDFHLLGRRNVQTLLLWWTYLNKALTAVDAEHLLIVDYNAMVAAPEMELRRLARLLNVEPSQTAIDSFCSDHVEPLLNRSKQEGGVSRVTSPLLWQFSDTLYVRLRSLSRKDKIAREDLNSVFEQLDTEELQPLYLQEMQFMNAYSYKKIISLRHRLIRTIHEANTLRDTFGGLPPSYELLSVQHKKLVKDYESLVNQYEIVMNSRGWRLLTAIRRLLVWRGR